MQVTVYVHPCVRIFSRWTVPVTRVDLYTGWHTDPTWMLDSLLAPYSCSTISPMMQQRWRSLCVYGEILLGSFSTVRLGQSSVSVWRVWVGRHLKVCHEKCFPDDIHWFNCNEQCGHFRKVLNVARHCTLLTTLSQQITPVTLRHLLFALCVIRWH